MATLACGFGVFAGAVFALFTIRLMVGATAVPAESQIFTWVAVIAGIIVTLLLLAGSVTTWTRQAAGHVILIVASALAIAYAVSFTVYNYFHGPDGYGAGDVGVVVVQVLFGVIPSLVTLLCATTAASSRAPTDSRRLNGAKEWAASGSKPGPKD
jgi:hypothetical protein